MSEDEGWPAGGVDVDGLHLSAADGEGLRRALLAHFARDEAREQVARDFAAQPDTWSVGAPWLGDAPRIGAYYLAASGGDVVLGRTLQITAGGRYGLSARLRRDGDGWVVASFGGEIVHRRR